MIDNSDTFRLHYDQSNDEWAILYTSADGGTFKSTADAWCLYDDPDEYYYPEAYPSSTICTRLRSRCTIPRR